MGAACIRTTQAPQGQILRLTRYARRLRVDVNLHYRRWSFRAGVKYFIEAGGLAREAAKARRRVRVKPVAEDSYITGKWHHGVCSGVNRGQPSADFRPRRISRP